MLDVNYDANDGWMDGWMKEGELSYFSSYGAVHGRSDLHRHVGAVRDVPLWKVGKEEKDGRWSNTWVDGDGRGRVVNVVSFVMRWVSSVSMLFYLATQLCVCVCACVCACLCVCVLKFPDLNYLRSRLRQHLCIAS